MFSSAERIGERGRSSLCSEVSLGNLILFFSHRQSFPHAKSKKVKRNKRRTHKIVGITVRMGTQLRRVRGTLNTPTQKYQSITSTTFQQFPMVRHATSFFSAMNFMFIFGSYPHLNQLPSQSLRQDDSRDRLVSCNHSIYKCNLNWFRCSQVELTHTLPMGWSARMHLTSAERSTYCLPGFHLQCASPDRACLNFPVKSFTASAERELGLFAKATKPAVNSSAVIILFISRKIASKSNKTSI